MNHWVLLTDHLLITKHRQNNFQQYAKISIDIPVYANITTHHFQRLFLCFWSKDWHFILINHACSCRP